MVVEVALPLFVLFVLRLPEVDVEVLRLLVVVEVVLVAVFDGRVLVDVVRG